MAFGPDMEERIVNLFKDSTVKNILHIGACLGEEKTFYDTLNPEKVYWFEPNPELIPELSKKIESDKYESVLFTHAVGRENGSLPFNIIGDDHGSNPGCSSLRNLKEHSTMYPKIKFKNSVIVSVINIDDFLKKNNLSTEFDIVSLDTQGNDFDILTTSECIFSAKAIVIETASIELYEEQVVEEKITQYMESKGFIKSYHSAWHPQWGDTLYIKK